MSTTTPDAWGTGEGAPGGDRAEAQRRGHGEAGGLLPRERMAAWSALLARPMLSYYLVVGITVLLLALGLVMVLSTSSAIALVNGTPMYQQFQRQLLGAALGLPILWIAARSSPRLFRAAAYPLLIVAILGLMLTLIPGVGVSSGGASRWIDLGPFQLQPSELGKFAFLLWGADLLARKEKLGQLTDWRHLLIPLLPGVGLISMLVMLGNDLGTTSVLLTIFLALLWVIGTPGRLFAGTLALIGMVLVVMAIHQQSGELVAEPDLISRGFMRAEESEEVLENAKKVVLETFAGINRETRTDPAEVKEEVRKALRRYFRKKLERHPVVLPYIIET